jgi:hypothetical protein
LSSSPLKIAPHSPLHTSLSRHCLRKGEGKMIFVVILAWMSVMPALLLLVIAIGMLMSHPPIFQE